MVFITFTMVVFDTFLKNCVFGFFNFLQKQSSIKNGLRALFYYQCNLWFKYYKEWSGTSVRMRAKSWSFEQQAEKFKKWMNVLHFQLCPQLFLTCPYTFETNCKPSSGRESQSNGQLCLEHSKYAWNEFVNKKNK